MHDQIDYFQVNLGPNSAVYLAARAYLDQQLALVSANNFINIRYATELIDAHLFLNTLKLHANETDIGVLISHLKRLLAVRWAFIKNTKSSYLHSNSLLNNFCISIAKFICDITQESRYQVLMPTIVDTKDYIGMFEDLDDYPLELFTLNSTKTFGLPLVLLDTYCNTGEAIPLHNPYIQTRSKGESLLPKEDFDLLVEHSLETKNLILNYNYYQFVMKEGAGLGARLRQLVDGLREGGQDGLGKENEAHTTSNIAILEFSTFLENLNDSVKKFLFNLKGSKRYTFADIWDVLTKKNKKALDCVEHNADLMMDIINNNKKLLYTNLADAEAKFNAARSQFNNCISRVSQFTVNNTISDDDELESLAKTLEARLVNNDLQLNLPFLKTYNSFTQSLLITATRLKLNNLARYFLSKVSFNRSIADKKQNTLLMIALSHENYELLPEIWANNPNIHATNSEGLTALHIAILTKRLDMVADVIEHGASPTIEKVGLNPLNLAISLGYIDIAIHLLKIAGVEHNTSQNPPPLHIATKYSQFKMVELLLNVHADVNYVHVYTGAPIHIAARENYPSMLKLLLQRGADPNLHNAVNMTALRIALSEGNIECANILLEHGANFDNVDIKDCDLTRIQFFQNPLTTDNIHKQLNALVSKFKNHPNLEELQKALWVRLTQLFADRPVTQVKAMLKIAKKHMIFHFNLYKIEFFSTKGQISKIIKEYSTQFKKTFKPNINN